MILKFSEAEGVLCTIPHRGRYAVITVPVKRLCGSRAPFWSRFWQNPQGAWVLWAWTLEAPPPEQLPTEFRCPAMSAPTQTLNLLEWFLILAEVCWQHGCIFAMGSRPDETDVVCGGVILPIRRLIVLLNNP